MRAHVFREFEKNFFSSPFGLKSAHVLSFRKFAQKRVLYDFGT